MSPSTQVRQRSLRWVTSTFFLAALLAAMVRPDRLSPLVPQPGLDPSWHAGLAMLANNQLPFGTRIVFTYGPLGFLNAPALYYVNTAALAFVFRFGLATATFAVLLSATRRRVPLYVAIPVAYVSGILLVGIATSDEAALGVAFALCVDRLCRTEDDPATHWRWMALGALAGLFVLEKQSIGVGIVALCVIALVCAPGTGRRAVLLTVEPALGVFAVAWFATGNGFGNVYGYVRTLIETAGGYSAMALDPTGRHEGLLLAAIAALTIIGTAIAYARHLPRRAGVGLVLASAVITWVFFKAGFVRQDHRFMFFAAIPLILAGFAFGSRATEPWLARKGIDLVAALLLFSFVGFEMIGMIPLSFRDPPRGLARFGDSVLTLAVPSRRHRVMADARAQLVKVYGIPAGMLERMTGETVAVLPYELSVAWAYPMIRWTPMPVLQDYAAYTRTLDDLDADFIESSEAPRFILRQPLYAAIDGRVGNFDPPATQLAIACNYRQVAANGGWQLLERTRDQCGAERPLGEARVEMGEPARVPKAAPGHIVVATFDMNLPELWKVVDTAYKAPLMFVTVNNAELPNRFIVRTAGAPHILRTPRSLGYSAPYTPLTIESMEFTCKCGPLEPSAVTITYSSIPFRASREPAGAK